MSIMRLISKILCLIAFMYSFFSYSRHSFTYNDCFILRMIRYYYMSYVIFFVRNVSNFRFPKLMKTKLSLLKIKMKNSSQILAFSFIYARAMPTLLLWLMYGKIRPRHDMPLNAESNFANSS